MFSKAPRTIRAWGRGALCAALALAALADLPAWAQDMSLPAGSVNINFPNDSPVALLKSTDDSHASARGAALAIDLRMALTLRNTAATHIRGLMLRVVTQEVTLGGKGSVSLPSLNVAPGESFPVRIELQLMRPTQAAMGPLVEVALDGVLFDNLGFYGPNRLGSRRILTAWEMEAERDRAYFKQVLAQAGSEGLRREILSVQARLDGRPQLDVRVLRGPAVNSAALGPEHSEQFAFLSFPDSPVEAVSGRTMIAGNQARAPVVEVRNRSAEAVRYVELRWLVRDANGRQYMAARLPVSGPGDIAPGKTATGAQETTLVFNQNNRPMPIQGAVGFVNQVEFASGKLWVPARQDLASGALAGVLPPTGEEERLANLYVRGGLNALIQELKKF